MATSSPLAAVDSQPTLPDDSSRPDSVNALERGFRVLDCFAAAGKPLGNSEVAQLTGIPRPSVTRLISTLVGLGHLRVVDGQERWELGAGVVRLAQAFLGTLNVREYARPHLQRLAESLGASAFVGVRDGLEVLVVEAARPRAAVAVISADIGTRMSLAYSALGRAWLLGVAPYTRQMMLQRLAEADVAAGKKQVALAHSLQAAQEQGYIVSIGEWHPVINAAAVPVRMADGQVITLNCGGPAFMLPEDQLVKVMVPQLLQAAQNLARDIGGLTGAELMQFNLAASASTAPAALSPKPRRGRSSSETKKHGDTQSK